jgi:hypothetical protein
MVQAVLKQDVLDSVSEMPKLIASFESSTSTPFSKNPEGCSLLFELAVLDYIKLI